MKMRRGHVLVSVLSLGALLAYGCGDDTTSEDDGSTTTTQTSTTTTTTTTVGPSSGGGPGSGGSGGGMEANGTCAAPFEISPGGMATGDTTGVPDTLASLGVCQDATADTGEHVYTFTPTETGVLTITLTPGSDTLDLLMYMNEVCDNPGTINQCGDAAAPDPDVISMRVKAGTPYFVVVDGWEAGSEGAYTLELSAVDVEAMCMDMMDDNMDALLDCEDPACGADAACTGIAAACTAAPALTPGTPQSGDTTGVSSLFAGTCTGSEGGEKLYSFTPTQDAILRLLLASGTDQGVHVRSDCDDFFTQLGCRDALAGGSDELLTHILLEGNTAHTVFVEAYTAGEEGPFTLTSQIVNITETEGNDTHQTANAFAPGTVGYISPGLDNDFFSVVVPATSNLTVASADVFAGDCAGSRIDTEIQILDTDGMTELAFNDDIDANGGNYCSSVTAMNVAAGTYFVRVSSSKEFCPVCRFGYTLTVNN